MLDLLLASVSAEDCTARPDPQGYRLAADRLEVSPSRCLVFEDSLAGVQAARSAGMSVVAIVGPNGYSSPVAREADGAIADYSSFPRTFSFAFRGRAFQ